MSGRTVPARFRARSVMTMGGTAATLTDANATLGYLSQDRLPSGLRLDAAKARNAIAAQIAAALGLSLEEAAYGAFLVGCAGIARAVRAVTIERGRDPRDFTLIAFGGNGPLFAAEMARTLAIGTVLVPPAPGVFPRLGCSRLTSNITSSGRSMRPWRN